MMIWARGWMVLVISTMRVLVCVRWRIIWIEWWWLIMKIMSAMIVVICAERWWIVMVIGLFVFTIREGEGLWWSLDPWSSLTNRSCVWPWVVGVSSRVCDCVYGRIYGLARLCDLVCRDSQTSSRQDNLMVGLWTVSAGEMGHTFDEGVEVYAIFFFFWGCSCDHNDCMLFSAVSLFLCLCTLQKRRWDKKTTIWVFNSFHFCNYFHSFS